MATRTNLKNITASLFLFFLTINCIGQINAHCDDFNKVQDYQIIAFGEACHGSYSDYEARGEMIDCLIKNVDSINVLIEMPHAAGIAINKYYNDEIDLDSLIEEVRYYGLQTNSFVDFIDRFRGNKHVSFYGVDMQTHQSTLSYLIETITELKPKIKDELTPIIDSLNYNFLFDYSDSAYLAYSIVVERNMKELKNSLIRNGLLESDQYLSIDYPFQIVEQYFKMLDYVKHDMFFEYRLHRDSCMAKNISSIHDFSKKQCFVIAANGHVMATNESKYPMMGGHLKNKYGGNYFVIASQYYEGDLLEVDVIDGKRAILQKVLNPPFKKSLSYKINQILQPKNDTLVIISETYGKTKKLFKRKILGQDMGTGRSDYKKAGLVFFDPGEYDAIYFIKSVTPSVNLAK